MQKFSGTLLTVAHDRWLLSQIGAEAWELGESGLTAYGDFAAYDAARRRRLAEDAADAAAPASREETAPPLSREEQKRAKRVQAEKRNARYKELKPLQARYEALEKELAAVLDQQGQVEARLADPVVYADHALSGELLRDFETCRQRGESLLEEMASLEERMDTIRQAWDED